uniref:beta strand repeat-containing protein n=1 Tax=uncultured Anaerovibrio sp. TaxID=361586 RepID=UPI00260C21B6
MKKNHRERKLTRLVLGALMLGGGTLFAPTAEAATTATITNGMADATSMQGAGMYQPAGINCWALNSSVTYNALTINGVHTNWKSWDFAGYARNSSSGTYGPVTVAMNNGELRSLYGVLLTGTATGNVTNASVIKTGGTVNSYVVGGRADKGNAIDNRVEISGGTVGQVMGGWVGGGYKANSNDVIISNSATINNSIKGGYIQSGSGEVNENTVNIMGGSINANVYGGASDDNNNEVNMTKNTVTVTGGTIGSGVNIHGAWSSKGLVSENSVTINGGTFQGNNTIYGGHSNNGDVTKNAVDIKTGTVGNVYGGHVIGTGNAGGDSADLGNTVTIDGGTIGDTNKTLVGGYSENGSAGYNNVYINGGTVKSQFVRGGHANGGDATNNTVKMTGGTIENAITLIGGYALGNSVDNSFIVSGGNITGTGGVFGGHANKDDSKAEGNRVDISQEKTGVATIINDDVYGGYVKSGTAGGNSANLGNQVNISGGTVNNVYGGFALNGVAKYNTVSISNGTVGNSAAVIGGIANGATNTAANNKVSVSGGNVTVSVIGGKVKTGNAESNEVEVSGGTLDRHVFGGQATESGNATKNTVTISQEEGKTTSIGLDVSAGYAVIGNAGGTTSDLGNHVNISGGTINGTVYGGYTKTGYANYNTINMTGGTVEGEYGINGGWVNDTGGGSADNNTITMSSGEVDKGIRGGRSFGKNGAASTASGNTITISGDAKVGGWVMGGRATGNNSGTQNYTANGNTVNINGGTFSYTSEIYAGLAGYNGTGSETGSVAKDNTVNINAAVSVNGIAVGKGATSSGNTLNLGATGITVGDKGVSYTQTIGITKDLAFANGKTVLSSTGAVTGVGTLDISGATALTGSTVPGTMTLLSGQNNNFSSLNLKYSGGTKAIGTGIVVKENAEAKDTENNVTLSYKNTHTVALADTDSKVNYTITNNVKGITPGVVTWVANGTARSGAGYIYDNNTAIDASGLSFAIANNDKAALASGSTMTLLGGASNLAGKTVTGKDRSQTVDYSAANGTALTGTLKGTVSTTADKVNYTATGMTLDKVNLADWNGTASAVPTGWTANLQD